MSSKGREITFSGRWPEEGPYKGDLSGIETTSETNVGKVWVQKGPDGEVLRVAAKAEEGKEGEWLDPNEDPKVFDLVLSFKKATQAAQNSRPNA